MNQPVNVHISPRSARRLRHAVLAASLVLSGAVLGVTGSAISQGVPPPDAWSDQAPTRVRPGAPGPGMAGPGMPGPGPHGPHARGQSPRFGGAMFGPGSAERFVDRLVHVTDASTEQKQKMTAIAVAAAQDLLSMREKHLAGRKQMLGVLTAPAIDRARLESLRGEQMKLLDDVSRRVAAALADIAEILSPAQRAELNRLVERRMGR